MREKKPGMFRTSVIMPIELWDRLKAVAHGRNLAELVRQAVDEFVTKREERTK